MYNFTPVCWLANFFAYWRGSMTFNFKFVKTMFHSGRLLAVYTPRNKYDGTTTDVTLATSNYCYREIIDLKDCSEFQITIPFVHTQPWMSVPQGSIGALQILILDPLVHPATVASNINMLIEVCGGPDLEFACPSTETFDAFCPALAYTAQMNTGTESFSDSVGGVSIPKEDLWASESCIGEKIYSIRTLIKRFSLVASSTGDYGYRTVRPFATEYCTNIDSSHYYTVLNKPDLYTYLSAPYLFSRGGVRIKNKTITAAAKGFANLRVAYTGSSQNAVCIDATAQSRSTIMKRLNPTVEIDEAITAGLDVQIPMYHMSYVRNQACEVCNGSVNLISNYALPGTCRVILSISMDANPSGGQYTYRAGADDLNFGYFVSVPPMTLL